tara:strand:- start:315 stop:734 length:420 start_codon:yes stop_codon:yes gene_type:complete
MLVTGSILVALIAIFRLFLFYATDETGFSAFFQIVLYFDMALLYGFLSVGRLQIRERGLWQCEGLLAWDKIESWRWVGDGHPTLLVKAKTRFPFLPSGGALPIPIAQKDQVENFLRERCLPKGEGDFGDGHEGVVPGVL